MRKLHSYFFIQLLIIIYLFYNLPIMAQKANLTFNPNGKFKIAQFTDLHICWQDKRSDIAFECIKNTIESEYPDLIVITGDLIYSQPAKQNFEHIMNFISQFKIPFALTFGNHDRQFGVNNDELLKIAEKTPYCLASDIKGLTGTGNYTLEIKGKQCPLNKLILYFLDSHEDSLLKKEGIAGYDYIHSDQINWYIQTAQNYRKQNKDIPIPALAFFHIPLPEYNQAASSEKAILYGTRREIACSPLLNSGLFSAMKEQGDIMGIFVGHDHDNDYAVNWHDILLAYGRFSGGPTEYTHLPNGARIIILEEDKRAINTYIRTTTGKIEQITSFPLDYK